MRRPRRSRRTPVAPEPRPEPVVADSRELTAQLLAIQDTIAAASAGLARQTQRLRAVIAASGPRVNGYAQASAAGADGSEHTS